MAGRTHRRAAALGDDAVQAMGERGLHQARADVDVEFLARVVGADVGHSGHHAGVTVTSSLVSPWRMLFISGSRSPSSKRATRLASAVRTARASSRASGMPMHWCSPNPNA